MKQNVFFIIIHKTIHAQSQWPSSRPLKYYKPQKFTHRFVFHEKDDIDTVPIQDVVMTLPHPTPIGGTKRASNQFVFDVILDKYFHV